MAYLTEQEQFKRFEYFTMELEEQMLNGEDFRTISNELPVIAHLSCPDTFKIIDVNDQYIQSIGYELEEVQENWMQYLMSTIHPESIRSILSFLPDFYENRDQNQTINFIEYTRLSDDTDYSPLVVFTKPSKLPSGRLLWLVVSPDDFGKVTKAMRKVIRMDEFKLNHFQRFQQLTSRELEVLKLLANGFNNPQIAEKLFIARSTVETHRKNLKRKLELSSLRDLMRYAFAFNLVEI